MIQYEQVVEKLNTLIKDDWWAIKLAQIKSPTETISCIYLIDSSNFGNKYRLYHSELNDWVTNDSQLWECCVCELREEYHRIKNVMSSVLESCSVISVNRKEMNNMKYTWHEALQMVANGQPMHTSKNEYSLYMKKFHNGVICWFNKRNDEFIAEVYISNEFTESIFEPYIKQVKLSDNEKVILRNVNSNYEWIARDKGGELYVYCAKPSKGELVWGSRESSIVLPFNHLFQGIKWEDNEPRLIEDLIKE